MIHNNPHIEALVLPLLNEELYLYCQDLSEVVYQMQYYIDTLQAAITEGHLLNTLNDQK